MHLGAVSLTLSLGLDGTWLDLAKRSYGAVLPLPPDFGSDARRFRQATIVHAATRDLLADDERGAQTGVGLVIVADPSSEKATSAR